MLFELQSVETTASAVVDEFPHCSACHHATVPYVTNLGSSRPCATCVQELLKQKDHQLAALYDKLCFKNVLLASWQKDLEGREYAARQFAQVLKDKDAKIASMGKQIEQQKSQALQELQMRIV